VAPASPLGGFPREGLSLDARREEASSLDARRGEAAHTEKNTPRLADDGTGNVQIREHPTQGVYVEGAAECVVTDAGGLAEALVAGERQRAVGATAMNERSSRSHTVFRIVVESRPRAAGEDTGVLVGALSLVDLAGSESVRLTQATGVRARRRRGIFLERAGGRARGAARSTLSAGGLGMRRPRRAARSTRAC